MVIQRQHATQEKEVKGKGEPKIGDFRAIKQIYDYDRKASNHYRSKMHQGEVGLFYDTDFYERFA
jgi:hypothetical protein